VFYDVGKTARRVGLASALVLTAALMAQASSAQKPAPAQKPAIYDNAAVILKTFPGDVQRVQGGVRLRLRTGNWVDIDASINPFGKGAPVICWYAPALHAAGVCVKAPGVTLTLLIDLRNGRRLSAPGRVFLTPDPTLIEIGPDDPHKAPADSLTLVRITPTEILEEGGAEFSGNYGPGAWVDAQCYRLTPYGPGPGGWLEKTAKDWRQVSARQSTVCQKRHGR
jgi:hypothetical protein